MNSSQTQSKSSEKERITYVQAILKLGLKRLYRIILFESSALKTFLINFVLTYNLRAGISLLIRILTVLRRHPSNILSLKLLIAESNFTIREEAVRTGLLVAFFTSIYKAILTLLGKLNYYRNSNRTSSHVKNSDSLVYSETDATTELWHSPVAGFLAGSSLFVMEASWRRSIALYMFTRALQCVYNYNKVNGYFHFWGSSWNHGDALLFSLAVGQIIYAYAMRPETLPPGYYYFIRDTGPYPEFQLEFLRTSCRKQDFNTRKFLDWMVRDSKGRPEIMKKVLPYVFYVNEAILDKSGIDYSDVSSLLTTFEPRKVEFVPLQSSHPYTTSSVWHCFLSFVKSGKFIAPVYLSLTIVPLLILKFNTFVSQPVRLLLMALKSTVRSSTFVATCFSLTSVGVSVQRMIREYPIEKQLNRAKTIAELKQIKIDDNKFMYWFAGFFAGFSVLIERKSRRSELALYALPKAIDSLFMILVDRKFISTIPYGDILLFCCSMSGIMFFIENQPETVSPLLLKLMNRCLKQKVILEYTAPKSSNEKLLKVKVESE